MADVDGSAEISLNGGSDVVRVSGVASADLTEADFILI